MAQEIKGRQTAFRAAEEGAQRYCVDCGDEIGTGTRCDKCLLSCEYCRADGFRTSAKLSNHKWQDHCAKCGEAHGQENMEHHVFDESKQIIDGREMKGGYLCPDCENQDNGGN